MNEKDIVIQLTRIANALEDLTRTSGGSISSLAQTIVSASNNLKK